MGALCAPTLSELMIILGKLNVYRDQSLRLLKYTTTRDVKVQKLQDSWKTTKVRKCKKKLQSKKVKNQQSKKKDLYLATAFCDIAVLWGPVLMHNI